MKRSFFILLAGVVGVGLILVFRPKQAVINEPVSMPQSVSTDEVAAVVIKDVSTELITQTSPPIFVPVPRKKPFDVVRAQSLADWTNAIPNIKQRSQFRGRSSWVAASIDTNSFPVILLTGANGNTFKFTAKLTDVEARDDDVRTIELHTPDMNIEEIREFGKQLCELQGLDATDFLAWCDKVGNQWVDAPLYDGKSLPLPNSNKFYGFGILRAYNNEKPWCINFFITSP